MSYMNRDYGIRDMRLSATQIARWVVEAEKELLGCSVAGLQKDELRKLVAISLTGQTEFVLSYLFVPGESVLHYYTPDTRGLRSRAKTPNFLPQLMGCVVNSIQQINFDRIVDIRLSDSKNKYGLVFELFGPGSNVYLLDENSHIITSLKASSQEMQYTPPPPPEGAHPAQLDPQQMMEAAAATPESTVGHLLGQIIRGCDRSFWTLVGQSANLETAIGDLSKSDATRLVRIINSRHQSVVSGDHPVEMSDTSIRWSPTEETPRDFMSLNDALSDLSTALGVAFARKSVHQRISHGIRQQRKRLESKLEKMQTVLSDATDADKYRIWAELLMINIDKIKKGMKSVSVVNIYDEQQTEIAVPLQPDLSPSANIKRLFKRYRKLTDGVKETRHQIEEVREGIEACNEYRDALDSADSFSDLLKLDRLLTKQKLLKPTPGKKHPRKLEQVAGFNPREYKTLAGESVLVGRNGPENEYVSFVLAKKHDLWFHSQQTPGSHVVLRLKNKNSPPSHESIVFAAQIAAYYSQARTSSKVPVIYTELRYLQKMKGGIPGKVKYTRVESIMVEPGLP